MASKLIQLKPCCLLCPEYQARETLADTHWAHSCTKKTTASEIHKAGRQNHCYSHKSILKSRKTNKQWLLGKYSYPCLLISSTCSTVKPKRKKLSAPISSRISTLAPSKVPMVNAPLSCKETNCSENRADHFHQI